MPPIFKKKIYRKCKCIANKKTTNIYYYTNEDFASKLVQGTQRNFYQKVKRVGGLKTQSGKLNIASLEGKTDQECAQAIGESYAAISQASAPVDKLILVDW